MTTTTTLDITAGKTYAVLGIVALSGAMVGAILLFARNAGVAAQKAATASAEASTAAAVQTATEKMTDAAADAPATDAEVISSLAEGKE